MADNTRNSISGTRRRMSVPLTATLDSGLEYYEATKMMRTDFHLREEFRAFVEREVQLNPLELLVLCRFTGMDGGRPQDFVEIAGTLGFNREQVRRYAMNAMKAVRTTAANLEQVS